jgi:hypothetical protein
MRLVHMHNVFLSGTDFWRYLDKAYNSVPGSGGSNPLHAIPCVHGLTNSHPCFGALAFHTLLLLFELIAACCLIQHGFPRTRKLRCASRRLESL